MLVAQWTFDNVAFYWDFCEKHRSNVYFCSWEVFQRLSIVYKLRKKSWVNKVIIGSIQNVTHLGSFFLLYLLLTLMITFVFHDYRHDSSSSISPVAEPEGIEIPNVLPTLEIPNSNRKRLLPERGRAFTCPGPLRARTTSERAEEKDQVRFSFILCWIRSEKVVIFGQR